MAELRIRLDVLAGFMNDPPIRVWLDERLVVEGSLLHGFIHHVEVKPGAHTLATAIHLTERIARRRTYTLQIPGEEYRQAAKSYEVKLVYSRLWGNFTRRLSLNDLDEMR